jgi:putative addiction module killer protein
MPCRIEDYTEGERSPFAEWFDRLDPTTAARIDRYVRRLESGNFGNVKPVGQGISELRIDFGPGFRVYFGMDGKTLVILLGGGDKRRQAADIAAAIERWQRYKKAKASHASDT